MSPEGRWSDRPQRGHLSFAGDLVQGKPVVRWGRKARDLPLEDRPAADRTGASKDSRSRTVKANLALFKGQAFRIVAILTALASSAVVLQAGQRWL
jgi:hypothetical protein